MSTGRFFSLMLAAMLATSIAGGGYSAASGAEHGWTVGSPLITGRAYATATTLADGRVLVAGGVDTEGRFLATAEIYDPHDGTWTPTPRMDQSRAHHGAIALLDGRVMVVGGAGDAAYQAAEIYDPAQDTWAFVGRMSIPRIGFAAARLADGRVLIAGGKWFSLRSSAETFDPATSTWSAAASMSHARGWGESLPTLHATPLPDGRVFVGSAGNEPPEIYEATTDSWTLAAEPPADAPAPYAVVALADGHVLGIPNVPRSGAPHAQSGADASLIRSGDAFVRRVDGSVRRDGARVDPSALLYDPALDRWRLTRPLAAAGSWEPIVASLPTGRVLVVSGEWAEDVQVYDPADNSWTRGRPTVESRSKPAAAVLGDGSVLLAGGVDQAAPSILAGSEIYAEVPKRADAFVGGSLGPSSAGDGSLVLRAHMWAVDGAPMMGRELRLYTSNGEVCRQITDENGDAQCAFVGAATVGGLIADSGFTVRFAGDASVWPVSAFAPVLA